MRQTRWSSPHRGLDSARPFRAYAGGSRAEEQQCVPGPRPVCSGVPKESAGEVGAECDICGNPAAVEDACGVLLCGLHAVEAAGLNLLSDQVRWDLTPAGELALSHADAELCESCGAPAGAPARRATCLWPKHRRGQRKATP